MNQTEKEIIKKAKRKFVKHKWLNVIVKPDAHLPYINSALQSIAIKSRNHLRHKDYILYVHEKYLTISSKSFTFEPVKLLIDDKLWVELYYTFDVTKVTDPDLLTDHDEEPI